MKKSGIRDKIRSNVLKELARERAAKRVKGEKRDPQDWKKRKEEEEASDSEDDYDNQLAASKIQTVSANQSKGSNLLSILPKPKNSSAFGPTIRIDKLLQLPERAVDVNLSNTHDNKAENEASRLADDGMLEVDLSKVVGEMDTQKIKELTVEKTHSNVIVPKGKEKQKNQITYLAQLGKATELERKEQAARSRVNKAAARSKYGW